MQIACMQKEFTKTLKLKKLVVVVVAKILADVSKNFKKQCLKIYHLDPVKSLQAPGLVW